MAGGRQIVDAISLDVAPGSFVGLLGPNGSGKSTLLHLLAGLRRPTTGRALIGDRDVGKLSARQRAREIAMVEQEAATELDLTVADVVALGRIPHRRRWGLEPAESSAGAVQEAMQACQVSHLASRRWATLSGGERQRAHLARALAQQPQILLLDEPTNHLDLGHQIDFMATVRGLGLTTIAALHDLDLAAAFCDSVVVLCDGGLVAAGPVAEVLTAELIAEVYGVDVVVESDPYSERPHIRWRVPKVTPLGQQPHPDHLCHRTGERPARGEGG